jgi:flagellar motor switch protein FliN/FliY
MTDSDPRHDPIPSPEVDPTVVADAAIRGANAQVEKMTEDAQSAVSVPLPDFGGGITNAAASEIGMLGDVDLDVRIELGRTSMLVDDVLKLSPDCVVELDKAAGDPVDIFVNGRHVARGEVLVLNENFCVRVSEIVGGMPEASAG